MSRKRPPEERILVLARDQRRKYGARLTFQVQRPEYIGGLENVTLLIDDGALATIEPGRVLSWEGGQRYHIEVVGFPTASDAEEAGMRTVCIPVMLTPNSSDCDSAALEVLTHPFQ